MDEEIEKAQFLQLVFGLQSSAWMLMGKVMNPMTGKIEKNLEQAKISIDTLEMLKNKTKGNLSKDEENILNSALNQLRLNFIEEVEKEKSGEHKHKEKSGKSADKIKEENNNL